MVSLDGYIAGPNDEAGRGLGEGAERLHYWVFGGRGARPPQKGGSVPRRRCPSSLANEPGARWTR